MPEAEILKSIADWLDEHHDIKADRVQMETSITDELMLDSLDQVEVVMALEELFQVQVTDEVAGSWRTIGDIVEFLATRPVDADPFQRTG